MRFEGGYHIAAHTSDEEAPPDDGGGAAAPFQGNGVLGMYPPDYMLQRRRRVEHADLIARCILQPGPPAAAAVDVPHSGRFLVSRRLAEVPVRADGTRYVRDEARLDMTDASSTATFSAYEATGGGAFLARLEGRALCPRHLPHCTLQSLELSPVFSTLPALSGGEQVDIGIYRVHVFTTPGESTVKVLAPGRRVDVLVVAGGGGGGFDGGGGGGAGGVIFTRGFQLDGRDAYTFTVGEGGASRGGSGGDSKFGGMVAVGGGGGGDHKSGGRDGGSGGGANYERSGPGRGTDGQGNSGGGNGGGRKAGGGGGGFSSPGGSSQRSPGGDGFDGTALVGTSMGEDGWFAGGGGGGSIDTSNGQGGRGSSAAGGGGDGGGKRGSGGRGKSGMVLIRYPLDAGSPPIVLHHGITLPPDAHARALSVEYETSGDEFVCRVRSSPTSRTVTLARYVWEAPARFRTLGFAGRDGATGFNRILVHPPPAADEEGAAVRFHVLTHTTVATGPGADDEPLVRSARATLDAALALGPGDDAVAAIREEHIVLWGRAWERGNVILEGRVPPALGVEEADDVGRGAGGDEEEEEAYRSLLRVHLLQQRLRFALYNVLCGTSLAGLLLLAAGDGAPLLLREDDGAPYSPGESGPLVQRWFLETHWVLPLLEGVAPRAAVRASLRRTYRRIATHVLEAQRTGAVSIPHPDMGYWAHDDGPALTPAALLCVALWDHLRATRDTQWLADAGFPMLASLADGLAAGVLREEEEERAGGWNDLRVRAAATGLRVAQEAAALLGVTGAGVEAWRQAEEGLVRLELLRAQGSGGETTGSGGDETGGEIGGEAGSGGDETGGEASSAPRAVLAWAALQPRLRPVARWEARGEQVRRIRAALAAPHLRDAATALSVRGWHDTHRVFALAWEAELQGELARELADTVEIQDGGGRRPARRVAARGADRVLAALEAMEAAMSAMGRGGAGPRGALDAGNLQLEPGRAGRGNDPYASALLLATFFSAVCGLRQEGGIARTGLHRRLAYAPVGPAVRSGKTAALSEALARVGLSGLLRLRT